MSTHAFRPTLKMASAVRRGPRLRKRFRRGDTEVGVGVEQLAARDMLGHANVKSMHSSFARHAVGKQAKAHEWDLDRDPSAGFITWLLGGGDAGEAWTARQAARLVKA